METPNNEAGLLTEKIMIIFSTHNENAIIKNLDVGEYNQIYEIIYQILKEYFDTTNY